jgi:hypothetical protein
VAAAVVHIALLSWSLTGSTVTSYYAFFVAIEIATLLFVIGYAGSWRKQVEARALAAEVAVAC